MKPILFNTEMVRAVLDGRKTVTRRIFKQKTALQGYNWTVLDGVYRLIPKFAPDLFNHAPYKPGDILYVRETWALDDRGELCYRADDDLPDGWHLTAWHPSIHMPKEAARLFLKVKEIRVERLQDIDDDGIVAEGLEIGAAFDELWDSTIKKADLDKYGWGANPWVWVIEFERCEKPQEVDHE